MIDHLRRWTLRLLLARLHTPRDVLRLACKRYADRPAIAMGERRLSYAELGDRVLRIATLWRQWGIGHGAPVFCLLPDGIAQLVVRHAAAEAGVMLVQLPPDLDDAALRQASDELAPQLIVHRRHHALPEGSARLWRLDESVEEALAAIIPEPDPRPLDPATLAGLGYTSGTTGAPKVLTVSHGAHLTSLRQVVANIDVRQRLAEPDRVLVGIPLGGAGSGLVLPTLLGGGCLIVPAHYDADALLDALVAFRATRLFTTPSLLIDLLDHPDIDAADLSPLRHLIYGTELMPAAKLEEALTRFGPILQQGYGSAEVLPPVSLLAPRDHLQGDPQAITPQAAPRAVLMSAGRVVPGVSVRIVGDDGSTLAPGQIGEVWVKSPTVFTGYWKRPDLTASTLRDGHLVTGDMGMLSADGYLTLLGRKTDLIRRGTQVIAPRLVEEAIHDHPAIKEASLVQVGERAVLAVSLRRQWRGRQAPEQWRWQLLAHLADRIPDWQWPDDIVVLEELPRSRLCKVLRREVRALLAARAAETCPA